MQSRNLLLAKALVFIALAAGITVACLPEQERTSYGPAESLGPRKFPEPDNPVPLVDAGTPSSSDLCDGKGPIDTGTCAKSWKTDIFGAMIKTTGTMKCAGGVTCHVDGTGTQPFINNDDASKAWAQLAHYKIAAVNKPYIDVCSKDNPDNSGILCNLGGTCGSSKMPKTEVGTQATDAQLDTIRTWLA